MDETAPSMGRFDLKPPGVRARFGRSEVRCPGTCVYLFWPDFHLLRFLPVLFPYKSRFSVMLPLGLQLVCVKGFVEAVFFNELPEDNGEAAR